MRQVPLFTALTDPESIHHLNPGILGNRWRLTVADLRSKAWLAILTCLLSLGFLQVSDPGFAAPFMIVVVNFTSGSQE